jgi:hypothetical protein
VEEVELMGVVSLTWPDILIIVAIDIILWVVLCWRPWQRP